MNRNHLIAAAVVATLGCAAASAQTVPPTLQQVQGVSRANTLYISGSSAISGALTNTILSSFCTPSTVQKITSSGNNTNFIGISCVPQSGVATNTGYYNIWIRYEGGSVSGYLPIVNNKPIKFISAAGLSNFTPAVNGNSTANGTDDSFTGVPFVSAINDLGIGDVEPQALIGNNYPTAYSTTVWGPQNPKGLYKLAGQQLVDEVYAVYVTETTASVTSNPFANAGSDLKLSHETLANVLNGTFTDWSQVYDISGNPVLTGSNTLPITIVDRETGSGSRAATDILLAGDACGATNGSALQSTLADTSGVDYFSTGDVQNAGKLIQGAVTYVSIDHALSGTNPTTVAIDIDGVVPSNLNAAQGIYPFWVEASYVNNTAITKGDSKAVNNIVSALQNEATTAELADIVAIPNVTSANGANGGAFNTDVYFKASKSAYNNGATGSATIYVNAFSRGGVTCSNPIDNAFE